MSNALARLSFWTCVGLCLWTGTAFGSSDEYYHYRYNGRYIGCDKNNSQGANYQEAVRQYTAAMKVYNGEWTDWDKRMQAYKNRNKEIEQYDKEYGEYLQNVADWQKTVGETGVGVTIGRNSYHEDKTTGARYSIITQLTEAVEVPSFSDIATYRSYCQNYALTNGTKGGWLKCENQYYDESGALRQIAFTRVTTNMEWGVGSENCLLGVGYVFYYRQMRMPFKDNPPEGDSRSPDPNAIARITRTVPLQEISGGYAGTIYPFAEKLAGISDECEKNSVVLIGTYEYPIKINGPVYVDGDVIIRGFVKGQGAIYAGRNIHIIGDISYYDPPSWPHSTEALGKAENQPDKVKERNKTKDLLLLAARGNIIVGDYTSTEWTNATQMAYLKLDSGKCKAAKTFEGDIGYGSGYPNGYDYTSFDEKGQTILESVVVTNHPAPYTGLLGIPWCHADGEQRDYVDGGGGLTRYHYDGYTDHNFRDRATQPRLRKRRYYEASIGGYAIQGLKQTTAVVGNKPNWKHSSTLWKRILAFFGVYDVSLPVDSNTDSGDVTEIDAVLYANHGIFGVAGGSTLKKLHLNGAMICKDEGLLTSFAGRFANDTSAQAWINWDMRIKSDLDSGVHIGAPEKTQGATAVRVKRVTWSAGH